jgi:hypothetical protein
MLLWGAFLALGGLSEARNNAANLVWLSGEPASAELYLPASADFVPRDVHSGRHRANLLLALGSISDALDVLMITHELAPQDRNLAEHTIRIAVAAGQPERVLAFAPIDELWPSGIAGSLAYASVTASFPNELQSTSLLSQTFGFARAPKELSLLSQGLKSGALEGAEFQRAREALEWLRQPLYDRQLIETQDVTELVRAGLGMTFTTISLGPNLMSNGSFERIEYSTRLPRLWSQHRWVGSPSYDIGSYVVGVDSLIALHGKHAGRIDGIAVERGVSEESRAGLWHVPVWLNAGVPYAVSFVYRTSGYDGRLHGPSIYFSEDVRAFSYEQFLPAAEAGWRRVILIAANRSGRDSAIEPLIRLWGVGTLWVDDVSVREIRGEGLELTRDLEPIVIVLPTP